MAKVAGTIFAQVAEPPEMEKVATGMEKVAWELVKTGELSEEQFHFLKEAGIFGRIGKWIAGRGTRKAIKAGVQGAGRPRTGLLTRMKQRVSRSSAKTTPKPRVQVAAGAPTSAARPKPTSSGPQVRRKGGGQVRPAQPQQQGAVMSPTGQVQAAPSRAPAVEQMPLRGRRGVAPAPAGSGAPATTGRVTPATTQGTPRGQGPYREAAPPAAQQPKSSTAKSKEMAAEAAQQQATKTQPAEGQQGGWLDRLRGKGGGQKKGGGWGRLALYGGAGLGAYGLYKGVGWGARQMEQASTTPWAYGGGWSPTPYGYGRSPYGPGSPTMGAGA